MSNYDMIPRIAIAGDQQTEVGLSAEEARAFAMQPDHRRGEWWSGRTALKRAAAEELCIPVETLTTVATPAGGPRMRFRASPAATPLPVHVSVTHRDGLAAAVADRRRRVGVDLEPLEPIAPESARYFLTGAEQRLPFPDRTSLWAMKEAAWKALGCDETTPFTSLELHFDDGGSLRDISLADRRYSAGASLLSPWPGYVLAVVWIEGED